MAEDKKPESFLPDYLKMDVPPVGEADRLISGHSEQKFSGKVAKEVKGLKGLADLTQKNYGIDIPYLTQSKDSVVDDKKPKLPKLVIHEEYAGPKKPFPNIAAVAEEFHGVGAKPYKEGRIKVSDIKPLPIEVNSGLPPLNKTGDKTGRGK